MKKIDFSGDERDILIYAFRYTLGRHTYAPGTVIAVILYNKDSLSDGDKALYKREIIEYFEAHPNDNGMDKAAWYKIVNEL